MSKILLSTDFSRNACRAAEYAIRVFGREATYLLLHLYEEPKGGSATAMMDFRALMKEDALRDLKDEQDRLVKKTGIDKSRIHILADYGSGGRQLADLARNYGQKVIVIGNVGRSDFETVFLGSIAFQTIRTSQVPVLLVPDTDLSDPKESVLATSKEIPRLSKEMERMNELLHLDVNLLRIVKSKEEMSGIFGRETSINYSRGDVDVHQEVARTPVEGILKFMDNHPDYILSLIPRDRSFWQRLMGRSSLTQTLSKEARFPILTWYRLGDRPDED